MPSQTRERRENMYQPTKDMKSLNNFLSIYKESFNIISSNLKLFTRIAIFFAFPLYIISVFVATPLPNLFPQQSINQLNITNPPPNVYTNQSTTQISSWIFAAFSIYILAFAVLVALSLFTFSSIAYSVACIYTDHTNVTVKTMICAFRKAWRKLLLTRLLQMAVIVGCSLVTGLLILALVIWFIYPTSQHSDTLVPIAAVLIILLAYIGGTMYISIYWIFGDVVAVLESTCGFGALSKSKSLVKGKAFLVIQVILPIGLFSLLQGWMFSKVVVKGDLIGLGLVTRIGCGVVGLPVLVAFSVFSVVVHVVTFLVCKADKGESIRKSNVMDHLDIYVDGYESLEMAKGYEQT